MSNNPKYVCQCLHGTTFITPDGKWIIGVDYETDVQEMHRQDVFNPHHIEHFVHQTDKIKQVTIEAVDDKS